MNRRRYGHEATAEINSERESLLRFLRRTEKRKTNIDDDTIEINDTHPTNTDEGELLQ